MSRWLRDFRLMPIVMVAIGCLFALKTFGLFSEGGYTLGQRLGGAAARGGDDRSGAPVTQLRSPAVPLEVASAPAPKSPGCRRCSIIRATSPRDHTTKAAEKAAMEKAEAAAAKRVRRRPSLRPTARRPGP